MGNPNHVFFSWIGPDFVHQTAAQNDCMYTTFDFRFTKKIAKTLLLFTVKLKQSLAIYFLKYLGLFRAQIFTNACSDPCVPS